MRHFTSMLLMVAVVLAAPACRQQPEGAPRVIVIGADPQIRDPAQGPLSPAEAVLVENVAQGLVRFDAVGNIVPGLAERWNVSDDGLSYIFRIASANWPDGKKITAQQVAKILKRAIGPNSHNPLRDTVGAIDDIVAMTDRVIEIRLVAPRPNMLTLLAQPDLAILRDGVGTGPFNAAPDRRTAGAFRLTRIIVSEDEETGKKDEVLLSAAQAEVAVRSFANGNSDLVLGGTFAELPYAQRVKLPRDSIVFDPASGLFGLLPRGNRNGIDKPEVRRLLSQAIDRDALIAALGVPNLASRATLLEAGLDGMPAPVAPAWFGTPLATRLPQLQAEAGRLFGKQPKSTISIALPFGPGGDAVLAVLARSWGALGLSVERAKSAESADFVLVDEVAPSSSAAWFVRNFRCGTAVVCDPAIDQLIDAARQTPIPQQRFALLQQAADKIDEEQLFVPITAPVRWSLVGRRIQGFTGNRFAVHTLTDLEQRPGTGN